MRSFIFHHRIATGVAVASVLAALAWLAFGYFAVQTLWIDEEVAEALPTFDQNAVASGADATTAPSTATDASSTNGGSAGNTTNSNTTDVATTDPTAAEPPGDATPPPPGAAPATTSTTSTTSTTLPASTASTTAPTTTVPPPAIVTSFTGSFVTDSHDTTGVVKVLTNGTSQRFLRFEEFATDNGPDVNVYLVNSAAGGVNDHVDLGDMRGNIGDQNYEIPPDVDLTTYDTVYLWCVRFSVSFAHADLAPA